MENKRFRRFYLFACVVIAAASAYPIYMGVRVAWEVFCNGFVPVERYPKYVIPYTPICIALILGVLLIPVFQKLFKKRDFLGGAIFCTGVFFLLERLMETKILVQSREMVPLEGWQMSLCYIPPEQFETRTWQAVDVLLGGYSPAFKFHFYIISLVLILSLLNCFYGFAKMIRQGNETRKRALTVQAATSVSFLGMCIWACFTSFYRDGEIMVSVLSAVLMAVFFALLGVTAGVFAGSFTLGKDKKLSILFPAMISILTTLAMYVGEMILLNGNLYRFGAGVFYEGIGGAAIAPVDVFIILISGIITALICRLINAPDAHKGSSTEKGQ